jgi:hypothetical protein
VKYVKPEVAPLEQAIDAIQAIGMKDTSPSDNQGTALSSASAYEADE